MDVVSVSFNNMQLKRPQLVRKRFDRIDLFCHAVALNAVQIDNNTQIIQPVIPGKHKGFPDLSFLNLAVPEQRIDAMRFMLEFCGKRHADGCGNTLSERARTHVHARNVFSVGMSLQTGAERSECAQFLCRKKPAHGQRAIIGGRGMSL